MSVGFPGVRVGEPVRYQALSVFPLLGNSGDSIRNWRFGSLLGPGFWRLKTRPSIFSNRW